MLSLNSKTYSNDFKSLFKRLSRSRSLNSSNYPKLRKVVSDEGKAIVQRCTGSNNHKFNLENIEFEELQGFKGLSIARNGSIFPSFSSLLFSSSSVTEIDSSLPSVRGNNCDFTNIDRDGQTRII